MGTLFKIAWRNVWRHGKRTLLTIITMTFGLGIYIGMDSMLKGMDRGGLENIVNLTDSSVRISTSAYEAERRSSPLDYGIDDVSGVEAFIMKDERVIATTSRTRFIGSLSNGIDAIPVVAVALDAKKDAQVFELPKYVQGEWFNGDSASGESRRIVLGNGLAKNLGVSVGDWVTLAARTRNESNNADDFLVSGLIDSSEPTINSSGVFISFADAEDFLELEELRTEIDVRMTHRVNLTDAMKDSDALASSICKQYPDLEAKSFGEVGRQFLELSKVKSKSTGIIIFTILVIAGVGIANTVLMSVYSRIREIGVLRAFGFKPEDISRLFLIEGGFIGIAGSIGGVLFGIALDLLLINVGYPVSTFVGDIDMGGFPIWGTLYGEWNPSTIVGAVIFGIVVALFSSRFPAKKAARLEVTNALRFV